MYLVEVHGYRGNRKKNTGRSFDAFLISEWYHKTDGLFLLLEHGRRCKRTLAKSKYESHVLPRLKEIEAWARDGVSDEDIAHNLHLAYSTFRRYKEANKALSAALARGKDYVDNVIVVNAFLRRITGYDTIETRREYVCVPDPDGGSEPVRVLVKEQEQVRHIPGDPRAAEFWLANRQKAKWRRTDKDQSAEDSGTETGVVELPQVMEKPEPPVEVVNDGE